MLVHDRHKQDQSCGGVNCEDRSKYPENMDSKWDGNQPQEYFCADNCNLVGGLNPSEKY